jgi:transcriptional regulator with XRE-family HTH domain
MHSEVYFMYDRQLTANRIFSARKDKELKQEEVGNALNITQPSYSDLETGKRDITAPELFILSELFDVSVTWLLGIKSLPQLTDRECLEVENFINYVLYRRKNRP